MLLAVQDNRNDIGMEKRVPMEPMLFGTPKAKLPKTRSHDPGFYILLSRICSSTQNVVLRN